MPAAAEQPSASPLVSVAMITFNHARFVRQAVESVLRQATNFRVEIIIADDCSTDETPTLLRSLEVEWPGRLTLLLRPANIGMTHNYYDVLARCRGRYIALLEGDDYWTDPTKLARQVAVLESHPKVALCHHNVDVLNESSGATFPFHSRVLPADMPGTALLSGNIPATCSVMYRRRFDRFPEWVHRCHLGDWPSHLLHAHDSRLAYIDRVMGVYRLHAGGVWSQQPQLKDLEKRIATARILAAELPESVRPAMASTVEWLTNAAAELMIRDGRFDDAREFVNRHGASLRGYEQLTAFYQGLSDENEGRRGPALKSFWRAARLRPAATRIGARDLLIAAGRTAFPRIYRLARWLGRRVRAVNCTSATH